MQVFAPESATFVSESVTFDLQKCHFCILKVELWGGKSSTFTRRLPNFRQKKGAFSCYYAKTMHTRFQN